MGPDTAIRVDVFHAYGHILDRACDGVISLEDCAARAARLVLDLQAGAAVAPKLARDSLRLLELASLPALGPAWAEHRKPEHPQSFAAVAVLLPGLTADNPERLLPPVYSTDITAEYAAAAPRQASPRRPRPHLPTVGLVLTTPHHLLAAPF